MRLLSLDYDPVYGDDDCERSSFDSDVSAFDFDVVIWDPEVSFQSYERRAYGQTYQGLPSLYDNDSVSMQADIARRRSELLDFLKSGRTVVVIVRPPQECYVATGEVTYSGTGRNRASTRIVKKIDLWAAVPVGDLALTRASGNRIKIEGEGALPALLRKYRKFLQYDAVMTTAPGTKFASVEGTNRVVGSYVKTKEGGLLIMLPAFDLVDDVEDESEQVTWKDESTQVQIDLLDAINKMTGNAANSRPAWSEKYATKGQLELRKTVVKQQARIESARAKLATLQQQKEESEAKDQLFLGTGRALELQVKEVLEMLNGKVTEPEPGRDDWKVEFPERRAVVEVKGVVKSAAEKNAAQLEKWVAGEMEETGVAPKGVLVVNTWRERELEKRTEADFPNQMIPYCTGREHCLITGLQLFVIRVEIEADPSKADFWRQKILDTSGVLEGVPDWRSVLTETNSKNGS